MPIAQGKSNATTAVVLVKDQLDLIRRAALVRVMSGKAARVSVSDIVREALAAHAPKLQAELACYDAAHAHPEAGR